MIVHETTATADLLVDLDEAMAREAEDAHRYLALARRAGETSAPALAAFFAKASDAKWGHVAALMRRVVDLGGAPRLARPGQAGEPLDVADMRDALEGCRERERGAIRLFSDLLDKVRESDEDTSELALRAMLEGVTEEDEIERMLAELR